MNQQLIQTARTIWSEQSTHRRNQNAALVESAKSQGITEWAHIAQWLNNNGHLTHRGRHWTAAGIRLYLKQHWKRYSNKPMA